MKLRRIAFGLISAVLALNMTGFAAIDLDFSNGLPSEVGGAVNILDVDAYSTSKKMHIEKNTVDASQVGASKTFTAISGTVYLNLGMSVGTSGTVFVDLHSATNKIYSLEITDGKIYDDGYKLYEGIVPNEEFTISLSGTAGGRLAGKVNGTSMGNVFSLGSGSIQEIKVYTTDANTTFDIYHLSAGSNSGKSFFYSEFKTDDVLDGWTAMVGEGDVAEVVESERPAHMSVIKQDDQPEEDPKITMSTSGDFKFTFEFSAYGMVTQRLRFEHSAGGLIYTDLFIEGETLSIWQASGSPLNDTLVTNLAQNVRHTLVLFGHKNAGTFDILLDGKLILQGRNVINGGANQIALMTFKLRNRSGWNGGGMNVYKFVVEDNYQTSTNVESAGFEAADGTPVTSLSGSTVYGRYNIENQSTSVFNGTIIMMYYENDVMKKVNFVPVEVDPFVATSVRCGIDMVESAPNKSVYMYLWDDINGMKPIDDEFSVIR